MPISTTSRQFRASGLLVWLEKCPNWSTSDISVCRDTVVLSVSVFIWMRQCFRCSLHQFNHDNAAYTTLMGKALYFAEMHNLQQYVMHYRKCKSIWVASNIAGEVQWHIATLTLMHSDGDGGGWHRGEDGMDGSRNEIKMRIRWFTSRPIWSS